MADKKNKTEYLETETEQDAENGIISDSDEAQDADFGIYIHKMRFPWDDDGETRTELRFDFGKLTGRDYEKIEREVTTRYKKSALNISTTTPFLGIMCAKASGVAYDRLLDMPMYEFTEIIAKAQLFLISRGQM